MEAKLAKMELTCREFRMLGRLTVEEESQKATKRLKGDINRVEVKVWKASAECQRVYWTRIPCITMSKKHFC